MITLWQKVRDAPQWPLARVGFASAPVPMALALLLRAVTAALPTLTVLAASRLAVATVEIVTHRGGGHVFWPAAGVVLAYGGGLLLPVLTGMLEGAIRMAVNTDVRTRMVEVCALPASVAHLEDPELHDAVGLVQQSAPYIREVGTGVTGFLVPLAQPIGQLAPCVLLGFWHWWAALAALVVLLSLTVLGFLLAMRYAGTQVTESRELRQTGYLAGLAMTGDAAKELRLFGLKRWLLTRQRGVWQTAMTEHWARQRRLLGRLGLQAAMRALTVAGLLALVAVDAVGHRLGVGELVAVLGAIRLLAALNDDWQANWNAGSGAEILRGFRRLEAAVSGSEMPGTTSPAGLPARSVRFENVSFHYPGTEHEIYAGLDLEIRAGESLAIVGANGAGKTTLVKLLARLYDVTGGRITADGIPLTELDPRSWQQRVACLFQDFTRFPLSLAANVALGAPALARDGAAIRRALERAGAADLADQLADGLDTILTTTFEGGTDLSGGQWQRVALARALLAVEAGAGILVLDEPTAALDAAAEAELYQRFLDITAGVTTVLISHRFSTVRKADRIVVLDGGRVVESGSHEHLLAAAGRYAEMFSLQASRFTDRGPDLPEPRSGDEPVSEPA